MVALKSTEIDAFIARPDPTRPVVLVYGPDAGLVRERADAIICACVDDPRDPFALARLDGDELAAEPARLIEEAHTVPLFGGRRAVAIKAGGRNFAAAIEALLAQPPADCRVVIEAGDLRRNAPLRALCERAKSAVAIPCYADGERELSRLIDEEMRAAGLTLAPEARAALISLIGGDRAASRNEIRKLALYARSNRRVEIDDVLAIVADASALALDAVIDATFAGRAGEQELQFAKAASAGVAPAAILSAALRHVAQLHRARLEFDDGADAGQALAGYIPPLHFRRRLLVEAALAAWSAPRLARAMSRLAEATLQARRQPALATTIARQALLAIAVNARKKE